MTLPTQTVGGIVSGIDTASVIEQLMEIERRPVDNLELRIEQLEAEKEGYSSLNTMILEFKSSVDILGKVSTWSSKTGTSSNEDILSVNALESAVVGSYSFRVARLAQTQQLTSKGFAETSSAVGSGEIRIDTAGSYLNTSTKLSELNGSDGVRRGSIKITDRSGSSAVIDLSAAEDVQDVLDAINSTDSIDVTAQLAADGAGIDILDASGGAGNMIISDYGAGYTATDLGIATGSSGVAGDVSGSDVFYLSESSMLSLLRDGRGIDDGTLGTITLTDNVTATDYTVDLSGAASIGDVIAAIENDTGGVFSVAVSGKGLSITNTAGNDFTITDDAIGGDTTATDLGIAGNSTGDTMTGANLIGGLNTVMISSLSGKDASGTISLGDIDITDRTGATANVDLSSANTLQDVIDAINSSGLSVTAAINKVGNGIVINDTSGATASNLIIADGGTGSAATDLGIAVDDAVDEINGGDLDRKYISRSTKLSSLNSGKGIYAGSITITDANGDIATGDLSSMETVGEVIDAINASGLAVEARINATGDGIEILNTVGSGDIKIEDVGSGTTALDLNISGSAVAGGSIDGSFEEVITVTSEDTLQSLVSKLGLSDSLVQAAIINDGSGVNPYHLSITSMVSGEIGRMVIDTDLESLGLSLTSEAQDALLLYGGSSSASSPMLLSSNENSFNSAVPGMSITANSANMDQMVTVNVERDTSNIVETVSSMVEAYNGLKEVVDILTLWDADEETGGLLFGDSKVHSMMSDIDRYLLSGVDGLSGGIYQLLDIGISFEYDSEEMESTLEFDESTLMEKLESNFEDVRDLMVLSRDYGRSNQNASLTSTNPAAAGSSLDNIINGDTSSSGFPTTNGYEAANAVDNDVITLHFDQPREIYQLIINHVDTATMPADEWSISDFVVEYLDSSTGDWEELRTYEGNTSAINYLSLPAGTTTSAIRLKVTDTNATDKKVRLTEIQALEYTGTMARMRKSLSSLTDSIDGLFATQEDSIDSKISDLEDTIEDMEERMESKELQLLNEFAAMEQALASMQSQSDYFLQQMSALNGSSS